MRTRIVLLTGLAAIVAAFMAASPTKAQQTAAGAPTFNKDVAPVLFKNCVTCHRPGEAAPMSLLTYEEARPYARAIANAVAKGTMPPWHSDAPAGTFHNERILGDAERDVLGRWAPAGAPRGNGESPAAPEFADGWSLGTPDLVLEMAEDYQVPAKGTIEYEWMYIPTNFTETKWVQSIEIRPGSREVVHHVLLYHRAKLDGKRPEIIRRNPAHSRTPREKPGSRPRRADLAGLPDRLIATYAPGTNPQTAPTGTAFRLEPGGILELQMHYTATGSPATDRTKVGITFAKDPLPREVIATHFLNGTLKLPAGAPNVEVSTAVDFVQDATVWGLFPHTHLRGKRWSYTLELPGGETRTVLSVPRYDFNWQTYYMFKEPLRVPKGAKLISTAWYDNSAGNKSNPDPTKDVFWGDQTWEEMQYSGILISPH